MTAATISYLPATDMVGRLAINPNGAEYVIVGLEFDAAVGQVIVLIDEIDLDESKRIGFPVGLFSLKGWTISQHVPHVL